MHLHKYQSTEYDDKIINSCRTCGWENMIKKITSENKELLDRLGSDYDQHGIPYWENEK